MNEYILQKQKIVCVIGFVAVIDANPTPNTHKAKDSTRVLILSHRQSRIGRWSCRAQKNWKPLPPLLRHALSIRRTNPFNPFFHPPRCPLLFLTLLFSIAFFGLLSVLSSFLSFIHCTKSEAFWKEDLFCKGPLVKKDHKLTTTFLIKTTHKNNKKVRNSRSCCCCCPLFPHSRTCLGSLSTPPKHILLTKWRFPKTILR